MASTSTRSPPTSRASAARSSVVVRTLSLEAAAAGAKPARARQAVSSSARAVRLVIVVSLEGVRAVRAQRAQKLEKEFIGGGVFRVAGAAQLPAHAAELTRPVSEHE